VSDLAVPGRTDIEGTTALVWSVIRSGAALQIAPQVVRFESSSVVNAASSRAAIAPGAIATVFGAGLARAGFETQVTVGGLRATVLAALPFQVNLVLPGELSPGEHVLRIVSPIGTAEKTITVGAAAPAIFMTSATRGAVLNADGSLNAPTRPARRDSVISIYGTGFAADQPVTALIGNRSVAVRYSGPAPGFPGLTQINVELPASLAPDLALPLVLEQGGQRTPVLELAVE
jgi:uncharacterized protein (TIGR03437 family)